MEKVRSYEQSPVRSWFTVETTPEGEAPQEIREQWIGVTLPVREEAPSSDTAGVGVLTGASVPMNEPIPVEVDDAISALHANGQHEAANWWQTNYADHFGSRKPMPLLFEASWGEQKAA